MEKICKNCGNNSGIEAFTGNIKCLSSGLMAKTEPSVNEDTGEVYYSLDKVMRAVPCIYFTSSSNDNKPIQVENKPIETEKEVAPKVLPDEKKEEIQDVKQPSSDQITMNW